MSKRYRGGSRSDIPVIKVETRDFDIEFSEEDLGHHYLLRCVGCGKAQGGNDRGISSHYLDCPSVGITNPYLIKEEE